MTLLPPPEAVAWARRNWGWISGGASALSVAAGLWLALWLTVRDHTGALDEIRVALKDARAEVVTEQRRDAEERRHWQDKSEARDETITTELRTLGREIAGLKGYMQRAEAARGWRVEMPRTPEPAGGRTN